jgi:hypothetical protein
MSGFGPSTVHHYRVNKITIPFSWYTIIPQSFEISYNGTPYIIPIFGGQYTAPQLATQITSSFNSVIGGGLVTCVFTNDGTNRFIISCNPLDSFVLHFEVNNLPVGQNYKSVGVAIGFVQPTNLTLSSTPVFSEQNTFAVNVTGPPNIYVKSSSLQIFYSSFFDRNPSTVIQTVPVGSNAGDYIVWQNTYPVGDFTQGPVKSVTNWDFQLVDEYNNYVDLRGIDWTIELEVYYTN